MIGLSDGPDAAKHRSLCPTGFLIKSTHLLLTNDLLSEVAKLCILSMEGPFKGQRVAMRDSKRGEDRSDEVRPEKRK